MSDPYSDLMPPETEGEVDKISSDAGRRAFAFEVDSPWSGKRLDAFLAACLAEYGVSRQRVKQLILDGEVKVDGAAAKLPRQLLVFGQTVCLNLADFAEASPEPQAGSLSIIFQDSDFLVVDKPPCLTVHPCPSCPGDTLVNILLHHFPQLSRLPGLRPGVVHRLDKDTSGLLLIALNEASRLKFSEAFAERRVHKEYLALVMGRPQPESGQIVQPIGRHPTLKTKMAVMRGGKEAISEYRTIFSGRAGEAEFSVLAVKIHTGRTHQIRVHLAHLGHPIWGDSLYGGARSLTACKRKAASDDASPIAARQMLHAWKLSFERPDTGEKLSFKSSLPPDFAECLSRLLSSPPQMVITGLPGCGKSALLNELCQLGVTVWSADAEVSRLYQPGGDGWIMLKNRYGTRFFNEQAGLDRQKLFDAMLAEPALRLEVERLIHPLVQYRLEKFWENNQPSPSGRAQTGGAEGEIFAAEVPLFLEAGWERQKRSCSSLWAELINRHRRSSVAFNAAPPQGVPLLVYVDAPADLRYQRLEQRGVSKDKAAALDSWQWPESRKKQGCDLIVDNGGDLERLKAEAMTLKEIVKDFNLMLHQEKCRLLQQLLDEL